MSISRSWTTRSPRYNNGVESPSTPMAPTRLVKPAKSYGNFKISAPVLLSTTNVQTINAPDVATAHKLRKVSSVASSSSQISDTNSDTSTSPRSRGTSVTDNSSVTSSPSSSNNSPKTNDLPSQFRTSASNLSTSPRKAKSSLDLKQHSRISASEERPPVPAIPRRDPSHSKSAHEQLAKKKSLQTLSGGSWQSKIGVPPLPPLPPNPPRSVPPQLPAANRSVRLSSEFFSNDPLLRWTTERTSTPTTRSTSNASAVSKSMYSTQSSSTSIPASTATRSTTSSLRSTSGSLSSSTKYPQTVPTTKQTQSLRAAAIDAHDQHPFGKELEQLEEIKEEFGGAVRDLDRDVDVQVMRERKLKRCAAEEYVKDLEPLWGFYFGVQVPTWI